MRRFESVAMLVLLSLGEAWLGLSAADREVLVLAATVDRVSPDVLGRALGCAPGTAATRLSRARARLRSQLVNP